PGFDAQFGAEQSDEIGSGYRGVRNDDGLEAFLRQGAHQLLDQKGFADAVGSVDQTAGPNGDQLFESVAMLFEDRRKDGRGDALPQGHLAGAPEGFEGSLRIKRTCQDAHNHGRYRFWS